MTKWHLQEAQDRLPEVVRKAAADWPQVITLRGNDAVVVVAVAEPKRLGMTPE